MNWKFVMLGLGLLVFQTEPPATTPPKASRTVAIEVGNVLMQGVWYQDGRDHVHDTEAKLHFVYRRPGLLRVNIGTGRVGSTDLEFNFSHDAAGSTLVGVTAMYRQNTDDERSPPSQRLKDLEGFVRVQSNDWGPGKPITCLFALQGQLADQRQHLLGSFLIMIPE